MGRRLVTCAVLPSLIACAACSFDGSAAFQGSDGGGRPPDADINRPDAIAPSDCPEAIHIEVQVDDLAEPLGPNQPYVHTLVGDTVKLSATGTCTRSGTITYAWQIAPTNKGANATALPDLSSEEITFYTLLPFDYIVYLTVGDGSTSATREIFAITAHGFELLDHVPGDDVKDLWAGIDYLWIGGASGAFRADLSDPDAAGTYALVEDLYNGDSIGNTIRAVHEEASGDFVWFGADIADGVAYRLNLLAGEITTSDTIAGSKARDISGATTGVRIATDRGVALSEDSQNFVLERGEAADAVSFGNTGAWSGKDKLYPLPNGNAVDVFGGNNKITAIADDASFTWVGGDDKGVAKLLGGMLQETFTSLNSQLIRNRVRALTTDSAGEVWAATQLGVGRYKQDRQVWVPMGESTGLTGVQDLRAVTVDEGGGRRAIYVGGKDGLSVMRLP